MNNALNFHSLLQGFFTDRLMAQRNVSPHTIAAYRDTFRLLFGFAQDHLCKQPAALILDDLNSSFITAFLDHLEQDRKNSARSRNARLAAIRSFFRYAAYRLPDQSSLIQRVLATPSKRYTRTLVEYLSDQETAALLDAPDRNTWSGRRDYILLLLAIQTGLRVSELCNLRNRDVTLGTGGHVRCTGKGRKERCTPLTRSVAKAIGAWMEEQHTQLDDPLFPNRAGRKLSTDGVQCILAKHVMIARHKCPSMGEKRVSPHVLRHTTAMNLLHSGVDMSGIALWLGHEHIETTHIYVEADLAMKEKILSQTATPGAKLQRFRPDDELLAFLKSL
jgi:site-specific recombinase XerD